MEIKTPLLKLASAISMSVIDDALKGSADPKAGDRLSSFVTSLINFTKADLAARIGRSEASASKRAKAIDALAGCWSAIGLNSQIDVAVKATALNCATDLAAVVGELPTGDTQQIRTYEPMF